jgi:hypothetical protein
MRAPSGLEAALTLSVLVGAISIARTVDDPDLSQQKLTHAAAALKERTPDYGPALKCVNCTLGWPTICSPGLRPRVRRLPRCLTDVAFR